jgi:hypothetical protein
MSALCDLRTLSQLFLVPTIYASTRVDWHAAFAERRFKPFDKTVGTFDGCKSLRKPSPRSGCLFEAGDLMRFCILDPGDGNRSRF